MTWPVKLSTFHFLLIFFLIAGTGLAAAKISKSKERHVVKKISKAATVAVFETNRGEIQFKLYDGLAPKTVENFKGLIQKGYYDGTVFHRVTRPTTECFPADPHPVLASLYDGSAQASWATRPGLLGGCCQP